MEDPLQDYSGLSLFPRKIAIPSGALKSTDSDESTHDFMKSMELRSPHKYLEQAKSTVDSSRELLNLEFASLVTTNNEHEDGAANGKEILRGRRPGLGRKKAQFTMIPKLSQPPLSSEPIRDAELSKDPKEFFAYFERREMAEKELRRLRGENVSDAIDFRLPKPERRRRPGLLGRTATYKHLYPSSSLPQNNDALVSSQETVEEGLLSPVNHTSQPEAVDSRVDLEKKLTGSIAESESKISTLFDELLGLKDLDRDGISSLVLERLQIKPTIIDEIPIPVFQESRINSKSCTALSDIQNLGQMVSGKALAKNKQVAKSPFQSLASFRPSISPLAPISVFQKHIQQSNMSNDRFSALDLSPPRNSSLGDVDEQSNHLDTRKEFIASSSSELKSMLPEVDVSTVSSEMITDRNELPYDKSVKDQFSRPDISNMTARSTDADSGLDVGNEIVKNVDDVGEEPWPSGQVDGNIESSCRICTDFQTAGSDESDENVGIISQNVEPFINDDLIVDRMKSKGHTTDHVDPAAGEPSYTADVIPVQRTQSMQEPSEVHLNDQNTADIPSGSSCRRKVGHIQSLAEVPLNDQSKAEVPPRKGQKRKEAKEPLEVPLNDLTKALPPQKSRKRKAFSRRHSLAAAGTHWEEGKRKSSRIKMRPLEYWKGERFLYGRVHESLATVIGLKYASPEKDAEDRFGEKRNLKVKSYVSGEYEELVKRVSFY